MLLASIIWFLLFCIILLIRHFIFWKPINIDHLYNNGPLLMGHRGSPIEAPENTLESFQKAVEQGIKAIEIDVICTEDGQVVCSHNHDLERETSGIGYIHKTSFENLRAVDAGVKFPELDFCQLPKLQDIFDALPNDIIFNIEIKSLSLFDLKTVRKVLNLLAEQNLNKRIIISSFNPMVLWRVKMFDRDIPTAYLWSDENVPGILKKPRFINLVHPDMLHPSAHFVDKKVVLLARRKKMKINVWTVNNMPAMQWLLKKGADGLISDFPALMLKTVYKS